MSIANLFTRLKAFFSPQPITNPASVDESSIITTIRSQMAHLAHLATIYHANYIRQWEACTVNSEAQTESVVFMVAAKENEIITADYDSLRCKVLMKFSKYDNLLLDSGDTSADWNTLRKDVIASPSGVGVHSHCS
ncbi:MAG: hypothetical protein EOP45_02390 [Sphingobacteriaceae bacterium]|nr:MAG: hypothetical protein EOP45_02390 [Sphingobacteriaceae bacterium]